MTKISRRRISREGEIVNLFWRAVALLANKQEVRSFLKALLTPTEMLMLAKRVEVVRHLLAGADYRSIKKQVQVSNSMITHIKNSLERGGYNGFALPLERIQKQDKKNSKRGRKALSEKS